MAGKESWNKMTRNVLVVHGGGRLQTALTRFQGDIIRMNIWKSLRLI